MRSRKRDHPRRIRGTLFMLPSKLLDGPNLSTLVLRYQKKKGSLRIEFPLKIEEIVVFYRI